MTTVVIIQARLGSTRLPEKILADIAGEPMLAHVVDRANRIPGATDVVVATTTEAEDDRVAGLCRMRGWQCFRGSEDDVLERYFVAARDANADVVVRVTSDCPLLDPEIGGKILAKLLGRISEVDYVSNTVHRTYPRGMDVEAFSYSALECAHREATSPSSREHVTPFIWQQPERFRIEQVLDDEDHSGFRWTVDTADDLTLVREVYTAFSNRTFAYRDVLSLFAARPELARLNEHVQQKAL